jgi:hypothetical protein
VPGRKPEDMLVRFWTKVDDRGGPDACWLWRAQISPNGYGSFTVGQIRTRRPKEYAHRLAYILHHRVPLPPRGSQTIDHRCRTRACVNPAHLELVSQRENLLRGMHRSAVAVRTGKCRRGHPFTVATTYRRANGWRNCRRCQNELAVASQTHCSHGHRFTPMNTYYNAGGTRICKRCARRRIDALANPTGAC